MLQSIRDRATGPIAWGIVGLITIPFAFWGIDSYMRGPSNIEVAEVGDVEISQVQLQRAYDQYYQRLQQLMGENFDPDSINNAQLRRGVLDNIVREELLTQHVRDSGYRVSDLAIANALREQTSFQENGSFSAERYREVLARNGYTPAAYEARLRNAMAVDQLQGGLTASAFVTRTEVEAAARLEKQQRRVQYLQFDAEKYARKANISAEDIKNFYHDQPDRFSTPERVQLEYIELDRTGLEPASKPDEVVLKAMYDAEKDSRFTKPEQRRARHILIQTEDEKDEAAKARIDELATKLNAGANFESLAKKYSEDTGSRDDGGDLGWIGLGVMVPEFEQALFSLSEGQTSDPVKSPFGWHLILLEELRPQQVQSFDSEEVQEVLLRLYREKELAERFQQMSKRLDDLSFDNPDSLEPAADALDLKVQTTNWLGREGGEGLAQHQAVLDAAFSAAVLEDRENSSLLKLSDDRLVVVRVKAHEPARQRPLKEVRDEIEDQLRRQYGVAEGRKLALAAVDRLREGESAGAVASDLNSSLEVPGWVERTADNIPAELVDTVFSMPQPRSGKASVRHASLADGNQAVLILSAVKDGDPAKLTEQERSDIESRLAARTANMEFRVYESAVKDSIDVTIHEETLQ